MFFANITIISSKFFGFSLEPIGTDNMVYGIVTLIYTRDMTLFTQLVSVIFGSIGFSLMCLGKSNYNYYLDLCNTLSLDIIDVNSWMQKDRKNLSAHNMADCFPFTDHCTKYYVHFTNRACICNTI